MEMLAGGADGRSVSGLKLGINRLVGDTVSEAQSVEDTGETEVLECGLVLRSIGYQGRNSIFFTMVKLRHFTYTNKFGKLEVGLIYLK